MRPSTAWLLHHPGPSVEASPRRAAEEGVAERPLEGPLPDKDVDEGCIWCQPGSQKTAIVNLKANLRSNRHISA